MMEVGNIIRLIANTFLIIGAISPVILAVFRLLATQTHNQRMINLAERAKIIVEALEQSGLTNDEKKKEALNKLSYYAKEVGITVTPDQLDDYIESAVRFIKHLGG